MVLSFLILLKKNCKLCYFFLFIFDIMFLDKVGKIMNEKELNVENSANEQPVLGGNESVNLMEDFAQAVTPEPTQLGSDQTVEQVVNESPAPVEVQPEVAVEPTPVIDQNAAPAEVAESDPVSVIDSNNMIQSDSGVPTEVGQVSLNETEITQKKKNNWIFIIILFAIVGAFVIALPFLVKMFGY